MRSRLRVWLPPFAGLILGMGCGGSVGTAGSAGDTGGDSSVTADAASSATDAAIDSAKNTHNGCIDAGVPDAPPDPALLPTIDCVPDAVVPGGQRSGPTRVRGTNGEFVDTCDSSGNLIMYACDARPPPLHQGIGTATGEVVAIPVDCGGQCANAACYGRCPGDGTGIGCPITGDTVTYEVVGAAGVLVFDEAAGRRFECKSLGSPPPPITEFSCTGTPKPGDSGTITTITGGWSGPCTTGAGAFLAFDRCPYTCTLVSSPVRDGG